MSLIKSDHSQCTAAAFAMVLRISRDELIEKLGHNGLERIIDDNAPPEPYCFRSHHPQEIIDILLDEGFAVTMVELEPMMVHGGQLVDHTPLLGKERFFLNLAHGDGVIFGVTGRSPKDKEAKPHAVAWDHVEQKIFDPRGYTYRWNKDQDFHPLQFFLVQRVE